MALTSTICLTPSGKTALDDYMQKPEVRDWIGTKRIYEKACEVTAAHLYHWADGMEDENRRDAFYAEIEELRYRFLSRGHVEESEMEDDFADLGQTINLTREKEEALENVRNQEAYLDDLRDKARDAAAKARSDLVDIRYREEALEREIVQAHILIEEANQAVHERGAEMYRKPKSLELTDRVSRLPIADLTMQGKVLAKKIDENGRLRVSAPQRDEAQLDLVEKQLCGALDTDIVTQASLQEQLGRILNKATQLAERAYTTENDHHAPQGTHCTLRVAAGMGQEVLLIQELKDCFWS